MRQKTEYKISNKRQLRIHRILPSVVADATVTTTLTKLPQCSDSGWLAGAAHGHILLGRKSSPLLSFFCFFGVTIQHKFSGNFPTSTGALSSLESLHLHRNHLSGAIPMSLQNGTHFEVLDLRENAFIGDVPKWIKKSKAFEYRTNFNVLRVIELSKNNFLGEIAKGVTNPGASQTLNLSQNSFSRTIPESIGSMKSLESIDFSANHYLNLSNNNLTGEIPSGIQLQGFHQSRFAANFVELLFQNVCRNMTTKMEGKEMSMKLKWFYLCCFIYIHICKYTAEES
ncbi:hypothetical protein CUMW_204000 [Citrus unshiu]|uniref:Leucine-rich repeat-containing N-terminal plant-type domain-containing protein n=1 Tax=Citrus unshiu TaxID=55188 RepID=A0A2H5Q7T7_CITUN|nr:hypothetical protein CUMW_204000 [Citrus unshiu]